MSPQILASPTGRSWGRFAWLVLSELYSTLRSPCLSGAATLTAAHRLLGLSAPSCPPSPICLPLSRAPSRWFSGTRPFPFPPRETGCQALPLPVRRRRAAEQVLTWDNRHPNGCSTVTSRLVNPTPVGVTVVLPEAVHGHDDGVVFPVVPDGQPVSPHLLLRPRGLQEILARTPVCSSTPVLLVGRPFWPVVTPHGQPAPLPAGHGPRASDGKTAWKTESQGRDPAPPKPGWALESAGLQGLRSNVPWARVPGLFALPIEADWGQSA